MSSRVTGRGTHVLIAALLLLAACGGSTTRTDVDALMRPGRVVIVGELHGTAEIPAAVSKAIGNATARDLNVHVGLEIPTDQTEAFTSYIDSAGGAKDEAMLLRSEFWGSDDGRSSEAMLELIEHVRSLRDDGRDVDLLLFDVPRDFTAKEADARDGVMSIFIAEAVKEHPKDAFIVLVGSFHASRALESTDEEPRSRPMARWLAGHVPYLVTLRATYGSGTAWTCDGEPLGCGPHRVVGDEQDGRPPFVLLGGGNEGFDGSLYVGGVTASRPARSRS